MSETCDGCHADATHFLCDTCLDNEGVENLRAEVERLTKALDVCSSVHAHNVKLHEERKRLREALRRVMGLDGRDETFCLDQKCGTCDECFARAALAGEDE